MSQAPTIAYPGGKARLAQQIISLLPKHGRTYVEPFCGRGNLFWSAASSSLKYQKWWINDIATIPFFRAIREIGHVIEVPELSRGEYERQREASKGCDSEALLLEPFLTFGGNGYCGSGFRGNHRGGVSSRAYQRTLRECHRIMCKTNPRLSALDWREMNLKDLGSEDTVVLDPPYPTTNVSSYTEATVDYVELVDTLLSANFRWVLCGYLHPALQRLGNPSWAKEIRFLYFTDKRERKFGEERRIECVWRSNPDDESSRPQISMPASLRTKIRIQDSASSLSFTALDEKIDEGLETVARDLSAALPYLLEMHRRLSAPGRRTDLRKGAPTGLTWSQWVESKRKRLGRSLRTIQYMLHGKTDASRNRQALAQRRAELRQEPDLSIPDAPLEIAAEMARLVLGMRGGIKANGSNWARLERLAERFLTTAGQAHLRQDGAPPLDSTENRIGERSWKM